ncbi:MAG: zinc ribbon domain-containing protein [Candidatus Diapherotrites archaeon]
MFNKRNCKRCGEKINKSYSFCPSCGTPLNKKQRGEDFGMLGESDSMEDFDVFANSLFGKIGGGVMNKVLANAMRMLEKEMQEGMKPQNPNINKMNNIPRTKFRLMINGKEINLDNNEIVKNQKEEKIKEKKVKFNEFTDEQIKKFSKLKKAEPKTSLKRIDDKILYEVELPGVESLKEISIVKLENSIEVKAITDKKAYLKRIPLNLPITNYDLSENLLVLELKGN